MIADLITQVFHYYNVGTVNISAGILSQCKTKMNRMENAKGKVKGGGRQMKLLNEKWSDGKYSTWKFKIYHSKFIS